MDRKLIRFWVNGFESLFKKEIPQFPVSSIYNVIVCCFFWFSKIWVSKKTTLEDIILDCGKV